MTLCVLLWATPGREAALVTYEDTVLAIVAEHGGRVLQRVRGDGSDGQPFEVQLIAFSSQAGYDSYLTDDRRSALAAERDAAVERTEVIRVTLV